MPAEFAIGPEVSGLVEPGRLAGTSAYRAGGGPAPRATSAEVSVQMSLTCAKESRWRTLYASYAGAFGSPCPKYSLVSSVARTRVADRSVSTASMVTSTSDLVYPRDVVVSVNARTSSNFRAWTAKRPRSASEATATADAPRHAANTR
ncbi:hypothetical protein CLV40_113157 [Actinokineospora auranticolor]|uniref:Uncharacterized protein n=1 Tax=Actinokineospora auranticolor TaxID=155976 RepID=A0A2S6GKG6_9PSEU|nr:hypothetical protein CLV40_113157 [Actinokineospora auranticolor]